MDQLICQFTELKTGVNWSKVIDHEVKSVFANLNEITNKYSDCILEDYIQQNKEKLDFCHKIKVIQMKLGTVWQNLMGHVDGIKNLGIGHDSGLDLMSDSMFPREKFIMELKNSIYTDNASSRKHNLSKLKSFERDNPEYTAIYGFINDKNKDGRDEVKHGVRYLSGNKLFQFIFGDQYESILVILKQKITDLIDS